MPDPLAEIPREPRIKVWIRLEDRVPDDPVLHRGFARGSLFSRDGRLVASTAQESLVRRIGGGDRAV